MCYWFCAIDIPSIEETQQDTIEQGGKEGSSGLESD